MMTIHLNGETRALPCGMTVSGLLSDIGLEPLKVAVERNLEIVPKSTFSDTALQDGDRIEIVQFVGGG